MGKIVIVGGFGWIGLHLIKQLRNHEIVVIDSHEPTDAEREFLSGQIENIKHCGGAFWAGSLGINGKLLRDADVVVSLPGQLGSVPSVENFSKNLRDSVIPHMLLLDALRTDSLTPLVVFPSTDLTYCYPPRCMYSANKLYLEDAFRIAHRVYGIPYVALRMATGYGPMQRRNSVVNLYVKLGLEGKNIPVWGDGLNRQAFIYADDMARAFKMACEGMFPTGVYPLCGHNSKIWEIADTVSRLVGGKVVREPFPELAEKVSVGDMPVFGNPPKFEPRILLAEGIRKTARWMKNEVEEAKEIKS